MFSLLVSQTTPLGGITDFGDNFMNGYSSLDSYYFNN